MNASALSIPRLVEMMKDAARRTFDLNLRYHHESDAVLYGKITQLDVIAEAHYCSNDLSEEDDKSLSLAGEEIQRAFTYLANRLFPQNNDPS